MLRDVAESPERGLHVNHRYLLDWVRIHNPPGAKILDYGCGGGGLVEAGRQEGLDVYGVELFYAGSDARVHAGERGLLGVWVHELEEQQRIPFPDESFDVVVTNQVLEHVEDIDVVLEEVHRVLRHGGHLLALFPSKWVLREGHIGVPFVHWFGRGSSVRRKYTTLARALGLGYFKGNQTRSEWVEEKLDWLDRFTFYRNRSAIHESLSRHFDIVHIEAPYAAYRLRQTPWRGLGGIVVMAPFSAAMGALVRMLSGYVIVGTRR
jgi:SAM-dependent methyltransferase